MRPPSHFPTGGVGRVVDAPWFNRTVLVAILLAGALAGIETSVSLMERHGAVLRFLDRAVLAVFIAEIALRMAACGRKPWHFFRDGWNVFDFTIIAVCCLPLDTHFAAVLRLARGLRLLRLVSALPKLQLLAGALLKSLGAMGYVSLLLSLIFYIYGVAGVHLFGSSTPEHFGSLGAALLTLFKIVTLDNWSDILAAARPAAPLASIAYFVSFILLGTMIMLNLFIGIIMNSMSEMHAEIEGRDKKAAAERDSAEELATQIAELRSVVRELSRTRAVRERLHC